MRKNQFSVIRLLSLVTMAACVLGAYGFYRSYQSAVIDDNIPEGIDSLIRRDDIKTLREASKIEGYEWFYLQLQGDRVVSVELRSSSESTVSFDTALERLVPMFSKLNKIEFRSGNDLFSSKHLNRLRQLKNLKSIYLNSDSLSTEDIDLFCVESSCSRLNKTSWGHEFNLFPFEVINFNR